MAVTHPQLTLKLTSTDLDTKELAELELGQSLRRELLDLYDSVADAQFAPGSVEANTLGPEGLDWNQIIITLIASGGVTATAITAVVEITKAWLQRNASRKIAIEFPDGSKLTAENITAEEQKRLEEALLQTLRGFTP